jgi:flagellar export protein FliJ
MAPKFGLQSVLDFRHSRVEALELDFSKLQEVRRQGLEMQAAYRQNLSDIYTRLQAGQEGDIDLFAIQHLRQDSLTIKKQLDQIVEALALLDGRIEDKRKEIVAARQAEETLNTLKNKETDRWQAEQVLIEGKQQDNVYIAQAFRRSNGAADV